MGGQDGGEEVKTERVQQDGQPLPDESRADVSVHGFWKWGTYALFYLQNFNLDAFSYLRQTSTKALTTAEKYNRYKYLLLFLEYRHSFTPMVYSVDRISGTEAVAA